MSSMIGDGVASPRLVLAVVGDALCPEGAPAVGACEPLQPVTATNAQAATTPRLRRSRIPSTGSRIRDSTPGHLPGMAPLLVLSCDRWSSGHPANTAFNGFPVLASILARDGYLPRQLRRSSTAGS